MQQGMTLVEVMIVLVIIVGIAVVAQQYHMKMILSNDELHKYQEDLLLSESDFDKDYQVLP